MNILNDPNREDHYRCILDDKTYWLEVVIQSEDVVSIRHKLPNQVIEDIKFKSTYLLVSNEFECFDSVIEQIYLSLIIQLGIPENKILFLSGTKDVKTLTTTVRNRVNKKFNARLIDIDSRFFNSAEKIIAKNCKNISAGFGFKRNLILNGNINYKKHYICLNKRWRLHRPSLIALLKSKGLLENGYVSLGTNDQNQTLYEIYDSIIEANKDSRELVTLLVNNKQLILDTESLIVDTEKFEDKKIELTRPLEHYYSSSFMSIVTETYFYNFNTSFLTEKTFKPIAYKQPFIIVGAPNSLKFLRELGYKTFNPYIDESYDSELNDSKRMFMILTEIEKICNFSSQHLRELALEVKHICDYNYQLLLSRQ